ncbi:2-(3-amino-3-carboxypropyl)histidine synthase subunit 2-like [Watersipora subatra]|uniref:2-(3-amino-3-carboxypropyl)histidine synthase subunit 2-like n=1 Tax=Watersipora subatra TaxID=2589382 RepID=UPI00355BD814
MSSDDAFYGDGAKVISTTININSNPRAEFDVDTFYEVSRCVEWLSSITHVSKVALQFPDELLPDSVFVIKILQQHLPQISFYILADTSYGSCCVDLVAAQHYNADALIHYGNSCLSPASGIPILWVFGRAALDIADCCEQLKQLVSSTKTENKSYVLMYEVQYAYIADELFLMARTLIPTLCLSHLRGTANLNSTVTSSEGIRLEVNGRSWSSTTGAKPSDYDVLYIGEEGRTLNNLMLIMNGSKFFSYNPSRRESRQETASVNKALMKRMFLIEKAKVANIIGIIVGTLAVADYLSIHKRLKELIKKAGRKSYTIVVGKLNSAKLANFMEVDMFVLVGCAENVLVDSKEYFKPIITPYELELAYNPSREWNGDYTTDFQTLLPNGSNHQALPEKVNVETDVSLVTGAIRTIGITDSADDGKQVAVQDRSTAVVLSHAKTAGEFLAGRTWVGLERDLGHTDIEKAREGQTGIAMGYDGEAT